MSKITISDLKDSNFHLIEELNADELKNISGGASFGAVLGGAITGAIVGSPLGGVGIVGGGIAGAVLVLLK